MNRLLLALAIAITSFALLMTGIEFGKMTPCSDVEQLDINPVQ